MADSGSLAIECCFAKSTSLVVCLAYASCKCLNRNAFGCFDCCNVATLHCMLLLPLSTVQPCNATGWYPGCTSRCASDRALRVVLFVWFQLPGRQVAVTAAASAMFTISCFQKVVGVGPGACMAAT